MHHVIFSRLKIKMLPKKTQVGMTFLTSFLTLEQVIAGPHYFHKPVLLKSPGNWSALRVDVYQHWVSMFYRHIFAMYIRKSRRGKTQNYIANTYHQRNIVKWTVFLFRNYFFNFLIEFWFYWSFEFLGNGIAKYTLKYS